MDADVKAGRATAEAKAAPGRNTLVGMACMAGSSFLFMAGNSIIKVLATSGIPPIETVFFRSVVSLVLLAPFALMTPGILSTQRLGLHLIRGLVQGASMICFFTGIVYVSLVEGNALEFTAPIFATAFAILFFGERIRARRLVAMGVGFLGAVIALRPGFKELNEGHGLLLLSAVLWAGVLLMIRSLSTSESALRQSLFIGFVLSPIAGLLAAFVWVTPDTRQFALLCTVATTATMGQWLFAQAFRFGEMSAVLPIDFSKLIWSSLFGYLLFQYQPDALVLLGATIIFGAGAYITIREAQLQRRTTAATPAV